MSKGAQAIAVEAADYAKKSFEQSTATLEKLVGAKTLDKAIEIQTDYLKTAYEGFVAQSTKLGELYANLAKEAFKPFEGSRSPKATAPSKPSRQLDERPRPRRPALCRAFSLSEPLRRSFGAWRRAAALLGTGAATIWCKPLRPSHSLRDAPRPAMCVDLADAPGATIHWSNGRRRL